MEVLHKDVEASHKDIQVLVIGDLHFNCDNIPESDKLCTQIIETVKNGAYTYVVILGDTMDKMNRMDMVPYNRAVRLLKDLSKLIVTYVLIGNHDRLNNKEYLTEEHPFVSLEGRNNLHIVNQPQVHIIEDKKFLFMPYVPVGRYNQCLEENKIDILQMTCIYSHQEFKGCTLNDDRSSTHGDPWPENYPLNISGHIHMYQKVRNNLIYPGTPIQHTFAEDTNKALTKFTFNENNTWTMERIPLNLPLRITLQIGVKDLEKVEFKQPHKYRIKIVCTSSERKTLINTALINGWTNNGVKVDYIVTNDDVVNNANITNTSNNSNSFTRTDFNYVLLQRLQSNTDLWNLYNAIIK
jgi:DNA repair exonuclease SbcCD nuclease subunit